MREERELVFHPDRHGLKMVLGELEAEIMELIWRQPAGEWCTVRDVYETMLGERRIAYTTVMNTMTRLAKKDILESARSDQAYLYRPRQSREAFIHGVVGRVLERLLVQFAGPTQTALESIAADHPDEAERVKGLIEEIAQRRGQGHAQGQGREQKREARGDRERGWDHAPGRGRRPKRGPQGEQS